jgi:hypothetical protein
MHGNLPLSSGVTEKENNSGTISQPGEAEKPSLASSAAEPAPCAFIAAAEWAVGAVPFCGAPSLPGSSYCAAHHRLCHLDPASAPAIELVLARELAPRATRRVRCLALSDVPEDDAEESESEAIAELRRALARRGEREEHE